MTGINIGYHSQGSKECRVLGELKRSGRAAAGIPVEAHRPALRQHQRLRGARFVDPGQVGPGSKRQPGKYPVKFLLSRIVSFCCWAVLICF